MLQRVLRLNHNYLQTGPIVNVVHAATIVQLLPILLIPKLFPFDSCIPVTIGDQ